jgi:hypothetical protein
MSTRILALKALELAKSIQAEAPLRYVPPSDGTRPRSESIVPFALVRNTRGYIERVTHQINGAYENGWFDACAVMMRRLLETLIIEVFEAKGLADKAKNPTTGDFLQLSDLVQLTIKESTWNLGRTTKTALPRLKHIGDQSAHSRRFNAHREDIDRVAGDFRVVCQELLYLAGLR